MKDSPARRLFRLMFKLMSYRSPRIAVPPPGGTLADVTVVNPGGERRREHTVVVEGDTVAQIFPSDSQDATLSGDRRYAGHYVLPGLIDMHVHIPPPQRELVNLLFLAYGVTTVREVGDADGTTWRGRRRINAGEVPGPRIFASGPVLDGDPPFLPTSWVVRDAVEAEDAVATVAGMGADFVKIHHKLSWEALVGIREAAARRGLPVVGHVPIGVPFEEAAVWDVQHLDGVVPYPQPPEGVLDFQRKWRDLDAARIDFYVQTSVEQGLVHTPTIVSGGGLVKMLDPSAQEDPSVYLLPRCYRDVIWSREGAPSIYRQFSEEALELMKQVLLRNKEVVGRLHQAGVRLHLGTDTTGMPFVVPGLALQEELGHFVEAGLSVEDAWVAGTRAAGESLGLAGLGTVQEGAPADLLIFEQDPTRDPAALSTLKGIVAQGRFYTRGFLEEALSRHRERFERLLYDRLSTSLIRLGMKRL